MTSNKIVLKKKRKTISSTLDINNRRHKNACKWQAYIKSSIWSPNNEAPKIKVAIAEATAADVEAGDAEDEEEDDDDGVEEEEEEEGDPFAAATVTLTFIP